MSIIAYNHLLHGIKILTGGIMSIDRLFYQQSSGLSPETVDKLLGANFLSLALISLVMTIAMFLVFVLMNNKRQAADDKRQDTLIKLFTDTDSPLVKSSKAATSAIELGNQRSEDWKKSIDSLASKTDEETAKIGSLITSTEGQTPSTLPQP